MPEFRFHLIRQTARSCDITVNADDFDAAHDLAWGRVAYIDWDGGDVDERLVSRSVLPMDPPFAPERHHLPGGTHREGSAADL